MLLKISSFAFTIHEQRHKNGDKQRIKPFYPKSKYMQSLGKVLSLFF
jgi:hypothetical protein